jgi:hypothetical protein
LNTDLVGFGGLQNPPTALFPESAEFWIFLAHRCAVAADRTVVPSHAQAVHRAVLALHGLNFLCDDTWALLHIEWIGAGPVALIPQGLLISWNLYLSLRATTELKPKLG